MALCNVIGIEAGQWMKADRIMILSSWLPTKNVTQPYQDHKLDLKDPMNVVDIKPSIINSVTASPPVLQSSVSISTSEVVSSVSNTREVSVESSLKPNAVPQNVVKDDVTVTKATTKLSESNDIKPSRVGDQPVNKNEKTPVKPIDSPVKEPPEVMVPPADKVQKDVVQNNNINHNNNNGGGVWQKLSNKIKALERNVSIAGGYLEELSVQYKKQIEDLERKVRQSGEALTVSSKIRDQDRERQKILQDQIGQLKIVVEEVSTRMETMSTWVSKTYIIHTKEFYF